MKMVSKYLKQTLQGEKTSRIPFWFMRQAGRYLPEYRDLRSTAGGFLDMCYNPDFAAEVTLQPLERFDMDGAILFSDILVTPHALGQGLEFVPGKGPVLEALKTASDIDKLAFNEDKIHTHLEPVYQTVGKLSKILPEDKTLIGFAGSPWTVATYMIEGGSSKDFGKVKSWAYRDPESFQNLMDTLVKTTSAYLIEQINRGADAVQVFDSWASALSYDQFDKWVIEPTRAIVDAVKTAHPDTPIIGFPKGVGARYTDYIEQTGVNAVGFDHALSLDFVRDDLQSKVTVQGGLDNALLLAGGDAMIQQAEKIVETLKDRPFVFNLGHGVIKETPPEHVAALSDFVKSYRKS